MGATTPGQPGAARGRTDEHTGKPKRRRVAAPFVELGRTAAPFLLHANAVLLEEFVDTAAAVHDLLLAGKERVAQRAHFDAQIFAQGGAGDEAVATGAGHFDFFILGMDAVFHVYNLKSCPDCRPGAERPGMLRKSIPGRKFWPDNREFRSNPAHVLFVGKPCRAAACPFQRFIESKNSALLLVARILSSRNSEGSI